MTDVEALRALLEADRWIEKVRAQRDNLAEAVELQNVEERLRALLVELRQSEEVLAPVRGAYEASREESRRLEARENELTRALASSTGAARDLAAMQHELDSVSAARSVAEDRELELLVEIEPLEAAVESVKRAGEPLVGRRAELREEIVALRAGLDEEIVALQAQREVLADALDDDVRARYETVSTRLGSPGAAQLVQGRCDGCRLALAPADLDKLKGESVGVCPSCGRMLIA